MLLELDEDLLEPADGELFALGREHGLARLAVLERLADVVREHPAGRAAVQLAVDAHRQLDVIRRAAVLLADDHVLRDVDQTPRQVARVGRAERRVGEPLAGTVGGDEVLEHRQAFHEVRLDRPLDDLTLRVRHQTAHTGELTDLVERSAGTGVGHHEDRVGLVERVLHRLRDDIGRLGPDRGDALPPLLLGHQAALVLALDLGHILLVAGEDGLLLGRDDDVVLRDRHAGLRRVAEGERLDRVEHRRDGEGAVLTDETVDERVELALRQRPVDEHLGACRLRRAPRRATARSRARR